MEEENKEQSSEFLYENMVSNSFLSFTAFIYAFFFPSLKIVLFILFLFIVSFYLSLRFVFDRYKSSSTTNNRKISLSIKIIASLCFSVILPFLLIILPTWAVFNTLNKFVKTQILLSNKFLKISTFLYSPKTHKEVFEPIAADWQEEYFEALFKKEIWKARWINVRYTYAFLAAMWQKSPLGDLIEFVVKIAKQ